MSKSSIHIKESHKGLLHKDLGVPQGEPIPASKLRIKESDSEAVKKRKRFALAAKKWKHEDGGYQLPEELELIDLPVADDGLEMGDVGFGNTASSQESGTLTPEQQQEISEETEKAGNLTFNFPKPNPIVKDRLYIPQNKVNVQFGNKYLQKGVDYLNQSINHGESVGRPVDEQYNSFFPAFKRDSTKMLFELGGQYLKKYEDAGIVGSSITPGSGLVTYTGNNANDGLQRFFTANYDKNEPLNGQKANDNAQIINATVSGLQSATNFAKGAVDMIGTNNLNNKVKAMENQNFAQSVYAQGFDNKGTTQGDTVQGRNALFAEGGVQDREVPRHLASGEVEGDESLKLNDGTIGMIDGASHENGGVPVNLKEGEKVFSKRLKDPDTKKSFAQMANRFNTEKEQKVISDKNSSELQRKTAELSLMLKNKEADKIFDKQENLKLGGFYGTLVAENAQSNHKKLALGGFLKKMQDGDEFVPKRQDALPFVDTQLTPGFSQEEIVQQEIDQDIASNPVPSLAESDPRFRSNAYADPIYGHLDKFKDNYEPVEGQTFAKVEGTQKQGSSGTFGGLSPEQKKEFFDRHGWFFKNKGYKLSDLSNPKVIGEFQKSYNQKHLDEFGSPYFDDKYVLSGKHPRGFDSKLGEYTYSAPLWKAKSYMTGEGELPAPSRHLSEPVVNYTERGVESLNPQVLAELDSSNPKVQVSRVADVIPSKTNLPKVKQKNRFEGDINLQGYIPDLYEREPLNYYRVNPNRIDPRYLDVQAQMNAITRGQRAVQSNLGDRGTNATANALQAQINAYNAQNEVMGNKYNYDRQQDAAAQQFNAQNKSQTDQYNQQSWANQLEIPRRTREEAIGRQKMTDSRASQERGEKYRKDLNDLKVMSQQKDLFDGMTQKQIMEILSKPEAMASFLALRGNRNYRYPTE